MTKESNFNKAYIMLKAIGFQSDVEILSTDRGAVNDIIVFETQGRRQVLRARTSEKFFRYEHGLPKEPLVAHFISAARPRDLEHNQKILHEALKNVGAKVKAPKVEGLPEIYRYGVEELSVPWTIQEYIDGPLISVLEDTQLWRDLGKRVGLLHNLNLPQAGRLNGQINQSPSEHVDAVLAEIKNLIPDGEMSREFNPQALDNLSLSLCHNDLHCLNVKSGFLLDWDNAFIANPALDIAKLKLWISLDDSGRFTSNDEFFDAFLSGYSEVNENLPESEVLDLYQLLFLCRVYTFEKENEDKGNIMKPPFSGSTGYLPHIQKLAGLA